MKTKNAILSSAFGIVDVLIRLIISLFMRNIFLSSFGTEYLGIYFLFDSIFGMLVALDCGISSSLFLKIYKPLEEHDESSIRSVFQLVKVVYTLRGILVAVVGLVIFFFLPGFIKDNTLPLSYIQKCYIMYLICNSTNYLVIFYQFFLESVQQRFLVNLVGIPVYIVQIVLQLVAIKINHSYPFYLTVTAGASIFINFGCMIITYLRFPYLRGKKIIKTEDKKDIFKLVKMAFHTLSAVISHYIDTFLISIFAGLSTTGLYGNYKTLNNSINNFINQITASTKDPLRSIVSINDKEKAKESIKNLTFLMFWIGGFCCICLAGLSNKFITMWLGREYLLPVMTVVTTCYVLYLSVQNFFLVDSYYTSYCYLDDKKSPIIEIITNLVISIILGKVLGITGIMVGTICYYTVQTFLRTRRLCKFFLDKEFFKSIIMKVIFYGLIVAIMSLCFGYLSNIYFIKNKLLDFTVTVVLIVIVVNLIFLLIFRKTNEYKYFYSVLKKIIHREIK